MRRLTIAGLFLLAAAGGAVWFPGGRAAAAPDIPAPVSVAGQAAVTGGPTSALLYDFGFAATRGTVSNAAPDGPAMRLTLYGSWWRVRGGVHFSGNTTGRRSIAYGQPGQGYTLDVPGTRAIGFGARIRYEKPATGTCFADTPNITQIGRYGLPLAASQVKLQLSSCATSRTRVFAECRISGTGSSSGTPPVVGTLPLVNGTGYDVSCVKSPDSSGHTVITLRVVSLATRAARVNRFTVPAVGLIRSSQALSTGNKYPLPAPAHNTDQFVGNMARAMYCTGPLSDVQHCLATYLVP